MSNRVTSTNHDNVTSDTDTVSSAGRVASAGSEIALNIRPMYTHADGHFVNNPNRPSSSVHNFDPEVEVFLQLIADIIHGCPSPQIAIQRRTLVLATATSIGLLLRIALWSGAMFSVVFDFLSARTHLACSPPPNGSLLYAGNLEYLHKFPPEITSEIIIHMPLLTLRSLRRTCRYYRALVDSIVDQHMSKLSALFGVEWPHLRLVLDVTHSYISGSVALLALFPTLHTPPLFQPGDLDIYCTKSGCRHLLRFWILLAGYAVCDTTNSQYRRNGLICRTLRLYRPGSPFLVNVIVSASGNPLLPIFKFHSTVVMNAISGTGIFSAYIEATSSFKGVVNSSVFGLRTENSARNLYTILHKYKARGFSLIGFSSDVPHICTRDPVCPLTVRSMLDTDSFFFKFDRPVPGHRSAGRPWNPSDTVTWALGGLACRTGFRHLGAGFVHALSSFPRRLVASSVDLENVDNTWRTRFTALRAAPTVTAAAATATLAMPVGSAGPDTSLLAHFAPPTLDIAAVLLALELEPLREPIREAIRGDGENDEDGD